MELQLGKSIMGFPPAAVSNMCVISKWQEVDDFTNPLQHTPRRWTQIDDSTGKKTTIGKSIFHTCKWWMVMSLWLFCQQWRAIWWFHTLAHHMDMTLLSVAAVCLVWCGVTIGLPCVNARVCENMRVVVFVCFFSVTAYCLISGHSPLSTWRLPLDEWLMCLSWWSRSDGTKGSGKQRRTGWVCDRRRGGGERERETKKVPCLTETLPFVFHVMLFESR